MPSHAESDPIRFEPAPSTAQGETAAPQEAGAPASSFWHWEPQEPLAQEPLAPATPGSAALPDGQTQTQPLPRLQRPVVQGRLPRLFLPRRARPARLLVFTSALLLLTVSSALLFAAITPPLAVLTPVGTLSFSSSGQIDATGTTGLNDLIQVTLQHVAPPAAGQAEYAWLLPDTGDDVTPPLLLGRLPVERSGNVHLHLTSAGNVDLLASYSRFLVTDQPATSFLAGPSPDPSTWRYQGAIPDIPVPGDPNRYSLLDHLRHLLAKDPELEAIGLHGGLALWAMRNTEKVLEWSSAAQGDWNGGQATDAIHRQVIRILDYLDGTAYVWQDVPPGTPLLVDPTMGRIGLVPLAANQQLPSYLEHINQHLTGLVQAPGHTPVQAALATTVYQEVAAVEHHLLTARQDALALLRMSSTKLQQQQALMLLDDLVSQVNAAYVGQPDASGHFEDGLSTIAAQVAHLAVIPILPLRAGEAEANV